MKSCAIAVFALAPLSVTAQQPATSPVQLTIYNGNFAVARTAVPLDLHAGTTEVLTTDVTSKLEPDSVVLRDVAGHHAFRILEQNYDAGVVNQQWLLDKFEGKTLNFQVAGPFTAVDANGDVRLAPAQIVQGRVIRAGQDPLIEVDGRMQFQLPGTPLFPADTQGLLLKPTLRWQIESQQPERFTAELDYITEGLSWQATYNVVVPEAAETGNAEEKADVLGWITIQNDSGTTFPQATVQLMAGDVAKLPGPRAAAVAKERFLAMDAVAAAPMVTQKAFDDFHLYDLHRSVALREGESKQVQFLEADGVTVKRTYVYDSSQPYVFSGLNEDRTFQDTGSHTVAVREQIKNTDANHLGMPLPAGRLRMYRRETTGQMQFVGESEVQHTPADQTVDLSGGNAFDLTGERHQVDFHIDARAHTMDETVEVKLSNAKQQPVVIHAVEHFNRAQNWQIMAKSADYSKRDSATADFPIRVPAKGSATLTYTVHYTW